jgi:ElaB/YqjD/DUF883 family membrane-anchored ribosome-binding protein
MADNSKTADDIRANGNGHGSDEERRIRELARRAEEAVRERAQAFRERAQDYYDDASEHIDTAQRYIVERVQERPLTTTLAAVGVGFLLGLILVGGRRR